MFGTKSEHADNRKAGRFYQYTAAHGLRELRLPAAAIPNSICFDKDGKQWVRFKLWLNHRDPGSETITVEKPLARDVTIKLRGTDKNDARPSVKLEFCLGSKRFQALFTLVNRKKFNYPVLLGRRFLADLATIDPAARYNMDPTCPKSQAE